MSAEFVSFIGDSFSKNDDAVKVMLRIRPPFENEQDDINHYEIVSGQQLNVKVPESSWTYKNIKRHHIESSFTFEFSNIFDWSTSQDRLFSSLIDGIVFDFLSGKDGLLFTYGITNSGKTYTLIGTPHDPGVLPRTINYVFKCLKNYHLGTEPQFKKCPYQGIVEVAPEDIKTCLDTKKQLFERFDQEFKERNKTGFFDSYFGKNDDIFDFRKIHPDGDDEINLGVDVLNIPDDVKTTHYIYMSIAEIYNEQIFDLLDSCVENPNFKRPSLKIQGDHKTGFFVKNLNSILISSAEEAYMVLKIGLSHRKMAETLMNQSSSRSHVVYTLNMIRCTELPNGVIATKSNEICFVDLAGAERQSTTHSDGIRLREASSINKSLLFLNRCIQDLRDNRVNSARYNVVSYRESRLTQLLQSFFVGRARMVLLINISPSVKVFDDTFSVLKFSSLTKEALDRPMGVELQQAIKVDAILNDSSALNFEDYSRRELIDIIHTLRVKLIDSAKNIESYDSLLRGEMCQFTMDMMTEIEEENERKIQLQRQLVSESYNVKIEILKDEIAELHEKLRNNKHNGEKDYDSEINSLKMELSNKDKDFNQLLSDVNIFKTDSSLEIKNLEEKIDDLKSIILQKDKEKLERNSKIADLNNEISVKNNEINKLHKINEEIQKNLQKSQNCIEDLKISKNESEKVTMRYNSMIKTSHKFSTLPQEVNYLKGDLAEIKSAFVEYTIQSKIVLKKMNERHSVSKATIKKLNQFIDSRKTIAQSLEDKNSVLLHRLRQNSKATTQFINRINKLESENKSRFEKSDKILQNISKVFPKLGKNCQQLKESLNNELIKNSKQMTDFEELMNNYKKIQDDFKSIVSKNDNYELEIEKLRSELLENSQALNTSKSYSNKAIEAKINDLELQLKSYKTLNEDYKTNVKKLEDIITERKIMAPLITAKMEPVKRPVSPSTKENYSGIFSKKNRQL